MLLVRHGQTSSNLTGALDTAPPGAELTEHGHAQAAGLVDRLAGEQMDAVYVSDLVRTHQTAAPLAQARGLAPVVHPGLREIQAGELEMTLDWKPFVEVILAWRTDLAVRMPGEAGETGSEVLDRMDSVFQHAYAAGHESIVAISHGAVMGAWTHARATNLPPDFLRTADRSNTVVVELHGDPHARSWRVVRWGDTIPAVA